MRMKNFEKLLLCLLSYFCFTACDEIDEDLDETRSTAENTIIMFFPWSNNLKPCFIQNISDFKQVLQQKGLDNERYVVCIESSHGKVDIIELKKANGSFVEDTLDSYSDPRFTTSEGITYLLDRYICITYTIIMIKTFGDSETEKIWNGKKSPKLPPEIHKRAFAKLLIIHSAESEEI